MTSSGHRPLRLAFDATAVPADRGGVGRYVDALLPALAEADVDLLVACQPRDADLMARLVPGAEVVPVRAAAEGRPQRMLWEQVGLPALVRRSGADVLHSPHYSMPVHAGVPVVVTLHDATFFSAPGLHSPVKSRYFRAATRYAVRNAAAIVVPSGATAREVGRYTRTAPDRFVVAYHGVDTDLFHPAPPESVAAVTHRLGLGTRPYIAFLGTLEPRKNVPALVRAWVREFRHDRLAPVLVLAGGPGWDPAVEPALAAVPAELTVVRAGYLPLEDLAPFLAGAVLVAYPSLGEGFGLPVLEAMACGAAVLTTRELSLPEVGGDAVAYCGTDEASIGQGLRALVDDDARREQLAVAAVARAATFTWEAAAQAHLRAYEAARAG